MLLQKHMQSRPHDVLLLKLVAEGDVVESLTVRLGGEEKPQKTHRRVVFCIVHTLRKGLGTGVSCTIWFRTISFDAKGLGATKLSPASWATLLILMDVLLIAISYGYL